MLDFFSAPVKLSGVVIRRFLRLYGGYMEVIMKNFLRIMMFVLVMPMFKMALATKPECKNPVEGRIKAFYQVFDVAYQAITHVSYKDGLSQQQITVARGQLAKAKELLDSIAGLVLLADNTPELACSLRVDNGERLGLGLSDDEIGQMIRLRLNDLNADIDILDQILDGYLPLVAANQGVIDLQEPLLAVVRAEQDEIVQAEAAPVLAVAPQQAPLLPPARATHWWSRLASVAGAVLIGATMVVEIMHSGEIVPVDRVPSYREPLLPEPAYGIRGSGLAQVTFWPF